MRLRRLNKAYAFVAGYCWIACPLCGQEFGGHEWRDIDGKSSVIYMDATGAGRGICPDCTREGKGNGQ